MHDDDFDDSVKKSKKKTKLKASCSTRKIDCHFSEIVHLVISCDHVNYYGHTIYSFSLKAGSALFQISCTLRKKMLFVESLGSFLFFFLFILICLYKIVTEMFKLSKGMNCFSVFIRG